MPGFRVFEKQISGSLLELNVLGEYNGQDLSGNPIFSPLVISNVDVASLPLTPLAPSVISGTVNSRTSMTVSWSAPNNSGRPPITEYRIFRAEDGGVESYVDTVTAPTLTFTDTPVPVNTPEIVFQYTVRAVNADGIGDASNIVALQYSGAPVQGPTAPTGLGFSQLAATSVRLSWSETADATVTKHGLFKGNTLVIDNLDKSALTYLWTGLTTGVQQVNVNIRRYNATYGWSPASNYVTFTPFIGTVAHDIVMGISEPLQTGNTYSQWDAVRCYRLNQVISQVAAQGARIAAVTDDPGVPQEGGASSATILENFLEDFYYGSGSSARQNVEMHFANSNEQPRDYKTGNLPSALINTFALMYAVVHKTTGGVRRYPKASMWVNMTNFTIQSQGAGPRFKAIAMYLDGMSCSMYPIGAYNAGFPVWTPYNQVVDDVVTTMIDWHNTYPQCNQFATWEIGSPIDHASRVAGSNYGNPTAQTNISIRPRYFMGGRDSAGTNWGGLMNYMFTKFDSAGIIMREQLYWDYQVDATSEPIRFRHDNNITNGDTEEAWRNWTPGSRLSDL